MMMTRKMGWVVTAMAAAAIVHAPLEAQSEPISDTDLAIELETEAGRLAQTSAGWSDAASLYVAAAGHRQHEDPQAREDLFMAANLYYQVGDLSGAMAALESAGTRALASGDAVLAAQMFANAAQVAEQAGMRNEERRLRSRAADVAYTAQPGLPTRG